MTVVNQTARRAFTYTGPPATQFPFYDLIEPTDATLLKVEYAPGAPDVPIETKLLYGTHYSVALAEDGSSSTVTLTDEGVAYLADHVGGEVDVLREPPFVQLTRYIEQGRFPARSHERGLDRLVHMVQYLSDRLGRFTVLQIVGPKGDTGASAYQDAVAQGGFVGTVQQWLASLVGPKGDKGDKGDQGVAGPQGEPGEPGPSGGGAGPVDVRLSRRGQVGTDDRRVAVGLGRARVRADVVNSVFYGAVIPGPEAAAHGDAVGVYFYEAGASGGPAPNLRLLGTLSREVGTVTWSFTRVPPSTLPLTHIIQRPEFHAYNGGTNPLAIDNFEFLLSFPEST